MLASVKSASNKYQLLPSNFLAKNSNYKVKQKKKRNKIYIT